MSNTVRFVIVLTVFGVLIILAYAFAFGAGSAAPTASFETRIPLPPIGNAGGSAPDTETPTAAPVISIPSPSETRRATIAPTDTLMPTPRSSTSGTTTPGTMNQP